MSRQVFSRFRRPFLTALVFAAGTAALFNQGLAQQNDGAFRQSQSELAGLFDAFDVMQAAMLREISAVNAAPAQRQARERFAHHLHMQAGMSMAEMMAMGMSMDVDRGPYDEAEAEARTRLMQLLKRRHSPQAARDAWDIEAIPSGVAAVIRHGRSFENRLYDILADVNLTDKTRLISLAVAEYQSSEWAVPSRPRPADALLAHDHAGAFAEGFPRLSGLAWSAQWLQLATMEALILQTQDRQYHGGIETISGRFWEKAGSDGGMSIFPAPSALPMAPAIAPELYSLSPEAAIVIDNLNRFETVIADILAYPELNGRQSAMQTAVERFTGNDGQFDDTVDYLLSALRGGIYDQGGPALGELTQSERNRSHSMMGMQHSIIMSNPN